MKIEITGRRGGKTTRAIEWVKKDKQNRVLLVHNEKERERLLALYPTLPKFCIATYAATDSQLIGRRVELWIDNIEGYMAHTLRGFKLAGGAMSGYTVTRTEVITPASGLTKEYPTIIPVIIVDTDA